MAAVALLATIGFGLYDVLQTQPIFKVPPPDVPTAAASDTTTQTIDVTAETPQLIALGSLYVEDENQNAFSDHAKVRKGSVFTVKWDARDTSSEQLHLL